MSEYIKYPRTPHLPWSKGATDDDIFVMKKSVSHFDNMSEIIVTEKMDGENTTLYHDYLHARAIIGVDHPSRSWIKSLHAQIKHEIPSNMRIVGENLFAKHSIHYNNLSSYFLVFAIFENDLCLSWHDTELISNMLGLATVPVLYRGKWSMSKIREFDARAIAEDNFEGYVVRNASSFLYADYGDNIAKYVRPNHVQTSDHWRNQAIIINGLKD